ncbi:MAG: T9SS type A sorting domain-containing protein [Calditrichaeota bacterium]|nr:T9SS type A sorting domain-containing protein [Calditrichota bacterium]MCB0268204.1 T9SS type A sorting domain-containing protein [Calditrichota bacterium]
MMQMLRQFFFTISGAILLMGIGYAQTETVVLQPIKDNTLYEDAGGAISNGSGEYFFAGKTNAGLIRRGLLAFDVAGTVPSGAVIDNVSLALSMSQTSSGDMSVSLHRVSQNWGEGTSDAGGNEGAGTTSTTNDATWIHTFFNTAQWNASGGDFSNEVSATQTVGASGSYAWESSQMVADVQDWLNNPGNNFGWVLIGNEGSNGTAKRFDSRENGAEANRPKLTITYTVATGIGDDENVAIAFDLAQNYPNPFNPSTQIRFTLNRAAQTRLTIFNALGQEVAMPVNEMRSAGTHEITFDATELVSGIYFYQLSAGQQTETRKMMLMK